MRLVQMIRQERREAAEGPEKRTNEVRAPGEDDEKVKKSWENGGFDPDYDSGNHPPGEEVPIDPLEAQSTSVRHTTKRRRI
jgi:hypothetical protein